MKHDGGGAYEGECIVSEGDLELDLDVLTHLKSWKHASAQKLQQYVENKNELLPREAAAGEMHTEVTKFNLDVPLLYDEARLQPRPSPIVSPSRFSLREWRSRLPAASSSERGMALH